MSVTTSAGPSAGHADKARLVHSDGRVVEDPRAGELTAAAADQQPFWLDLPGVSEQHADWLERIFGLHPLVVEDAQQFGERPKLEQFDDYIAVVVYGAGTNASLDRLDQPASLPGSSGTEAADISPQDRAQRGALHRLHALHHHRAPGRLPRHH